MDESDWKEWLRDDVLLVVSLGEGFVGKSGVGENCCMCITSTVYC